MKVASKIIFLFKDADGVGAAISDALHPNPSSTLQRLEESFELSLERYGVKDLKASGSIIHFVDDGGAYQVSLLLLQIYKPPILVCVLNEVLALLIGEEPSSMPTIVVPCLFSASKLTWKTRNSTLNVSKASLYGIQVGANTDITESMITKTQIPPSSLQIYDEPIACFLQLVRVLKVPAFILIGQRGQHLSGKALGEELEILYEIGELLASTFDLRFLRERVMCNPRDKSRDVEEPWRALYG
ncbi:uncharacterized protein LOC131153182 [Malania oleifera]|uniref:uncharacterized protein LOC131153182 n=1 Tax=Malania oleifera TaxID=397392 RepID=UPI0025AEBF96|nr:uncharacterized protein LOC131153182 [Malania oleifera]XP_057961297.1 uncharacterized protein LOC131153182 [Malania oleifera]XP_057961298.1 uncharacterized protein LOC131153182 [Malania oleifera]